jgi:hypothetical protein
VIRIGSLIRVYTEQTGLDHRDKAATVPAGSAWRVTYLEVDQDGLPSVRVWCEKPKLGVIVTLGIADFGDHNIEVIES